jgi:hypothetical protein
LLFLLLFCCWSLIALCWRVDLPSVTSCLPCKPFSSLSLSLSLF